MCCQFDSFSCFVIQPSKSLILGRLLDKVSGSKSSSFWHRLPGSTTAVRFIYNDTNGNLFFDHDGVGGAAQVQLATLAGTPTIDNADIVVI
jgi:Ca2+-binding RTX toxin-like protein